MKDNANPVRATYEKRYLKSPFKFFGTSVPFTDKVAKEFRKENREANCEYVLNLSVRLWSSDYHDEKRLGLRILQYYPEYLDFAIMPVLEEMLLSSTGWDFVDDISIHLVGTVLEKDRRTYRYLKKWSRSDNFWMRRASLISQVLLFRKGKGDKSLFFGFAEEMISEKQFFIRKAIGWTLREMSKADPESVFTFLLKVKDKASGLTLREGSKQLDEKQRRRIL
ncbi:MAG TPA: DNA alkylation repair protein [Thermodesulfovibrionales bacterium]|nr:DNA alkylation repair protein [Thermodesulfovibrionales bacterium]